jgi:hypothetical protein
MRHDFKIRTFSAKAARDFSYLVVKDVEQGH